jgi:hypothetical protein
MPIIPTLFKNLTDFTPGCSIGSMLTEYLTEEQLIDFAEQHGCEGVTHWQLERWHKQDVIPRPMVERLGYGKGTCSTYPVEAGPQVLAVYRLLKVTRNFDVVRFQLWQEGYSISLSLLKETIRQLVPQLRWKIPRQEEKKYDLVERRVETVLQKIRGPLFRFLFKRFGKNLEDLRSFIHIQMSLVYGIPLIFEPSHHQDELSSIDIFTQGLGLEVWTFLPKDLTADFQQFSDKGILSISNMNIVLERATEEDLRRADMRSDLIALLFEVFEIMGILPKLLQSLRLSMPTPPFQALSLVFLLHLEEHGYANNMDELLKVCRVQAPRFRAFQALCLALQQEIPEVAKELSTPQKLWQKIKDLSEPEREQYLARKNEHLRGIYLQHQTRLDAFWQRHPAVRHALEAVDPFSSSGSELV